MRRDKGEKSDHETRETQETNNNSLTATYSTLTLSLSKGAGPEKRGLA